MHEPSSPSSQCWIYRAQSFQLTRWLHNNTAVQAKLWLHNNTSNKAELCAVCLINPNVIITNNREGNARQNKMSPLTGLSTCREQSLDTAAMLQAMPGRNGFGNNMLDT